MKPYELAVLGMGTMGQNLARNFASHKVLTLVYNRHPEKAAVFIKNYGGDHLSDRKDLKSLCEDLILPRKLLLMVPAGAAVDETIAGVLPHLSAGDIVIDGGNSHYTDTIRRAQDLKKRGIQFVGLGVSGGASGALHGPSLMPGCEKTTWQSLQPLLAKIAARDFKGKPCVTHVGKDGAGHYVKMVHNGIEYGMMQLMAEAYHLLKRVFGLSADAIATIFAEYNEGDLRSFLFQIAVPVLRQPDEYGKGNLIDFILDQASQKGTGQSVAMDALMRGIALPTITEAVYARSMSLSKTDREAINKKVRKPGTRNLIPLNKFKKILEAALYASMISCYAQGFALMQRAATEQGWKIDLSEIVRTWQGGCIIRADLLRSIEKAFRSGKNRGVPLFGMKEIQTILQANLKAWRQAVCFGIDKGIPLPAMASALIYFESMTSALLPANFIQGLRDYFGSHTYERTDRPGVFHTQWK